MLPEKEKVWVLLDQGLGFQEVRDKKEKLLYHYKSCVDKFPYDILHEGKKKQSSLQKNVCCHTALPLRKKEIINRMVEKAKSLTLSQAKKKDFGESEKYVSFTDGEDGRASMNQKAKTGI